MSILLLYTLYFFFFFNDTATTEIYTLSLHDALPIRSACAPSPLPTGAAPGRFTFPKIGGGRVHSDRKSTRLNSSHDQISYAVFCLKKKKKKNINKRYKKKKKKKKKKKQKEKKK